MNETAQSDQSNPWDASSSTSSTASDPWSTASTTTDQATTTAHTAEQADPQSWLNANASSDTSGIDWAHPFQDAVIPFDHWVENILDGLVNYGRPIFQAIRTPIDFILTAFQGLFISMPSLIMLALLVLITWQLAGRKMAFASFIGLSLIGLVGAWPEAMVTLSLVLTAVFFCLIIGIPMGIWLARSQTAAKIIRPILDAMQTTPAFVYLVPIVMLFGIGNVPGVVVTIIFALPPIVRLTILGIEQVPADLIEAGHAFGANQKQMLYRVQLPLAMPTIMAGVNQTLMLSLSMVVIASMIAVGGLGQMVLRGIGRLDMGLAAVGGLGIVIIAILLDRLTQHMGETSRNRQGHWYQSGPVSWPSRIKQKIAPKKEQTSKVSKHQSTQS